MGISLRDQLFQAGLVTEEQVIEAEKPRKKKPQAHNKNKPKPKKKKPAATSDLAKFYQQRTNQERKEKQEEEKQKQEAARLKKERREKVGKLVKAHKIDSDEGEIRYNFVVGKTVKYLFVTDQQLEQLSNGELAITFHSGKRVLIPNEIGKEILAIDPEKIVVLAE